MGIGIIFGFVLYSYILTKVVSFLGSTPDYTFDVCFNIRIQRTSPSGTWNTV